MQTTSIHDRFDEYDLETAIAVLDRINPHNYTADLLRSMVAVNCDDEEKPTVISTAGWVASNYRTHDGRIKWRVTLSPSVVLAYLDRMKTPD